MTHKASSAIRLPVKAKTQTDGHTCGACAMYALTRYHEQGYSFKDIRGLLGTDHSLPLFPGRKQIESLLEAQLEGWLGTLPVDVFYSLWALGFTSKVLPLGQKSFRRDLRNQLEQDYPVVGLVSTIWGPHWVLLTGISPKGISITDSLDPSRKVFWKQEKVNRELLGAVAAIPGEDWLIPAMTRSVPFHTKLVARYSKLGLRSLTGRGVAA